MREKDCQHGILALSGGGGGVTIGKHTIHLLFLYDTSKKKNLSELLRFTFGVLKIQQNIFRHVSLSYSDSLCILSLRAHIFHKFWKTPGHFVL